MPEPTRKIDSVRPELPERAAGPIKVRTLLPRVPPAQHDGGPGERRDLAARAEILRRIESEYREMPGLRLTLPQAQRLFALRDDVCARVLAALADQAVLRRDANGAYVLNGHRP
ncbi:MAG: hypothetical protein RJA55_2879 [Acidobacteriota bacterium]